MGEALIRGLIFLAMCGICASAFFWPLLGSLRRRPLRIAGEPIRAPLDAIVVINAMIGAYVIACLVGIYLEP